MTLELGLALISALAVVSLLSMRWGYAKGCEAGWAMARNEIFDMLREVDRAAWRETIARLGRARRWPPAPPGYQPTSDPGGPPAKQEPKP